LGDVGAGGENDLGDAGDGQPAALTQPQWPGFRAALIQPRRDALPSASRQRDGADLIAFAV
jgi:hypothetical protein